MFETTRKYSEEQYCSKEEVEKDFQVGTLETIWAQIQEYRSLFKRDILTLDGKSIWIVLNPYVLIQIEQVMKLFLQTASVTSQIPDCFHVDEYRILKAMKEERVDVSVAYAYYMSLLNVKLPSSIMNFLCYWQGCELIKLYIFSFIEKDDRQSKCLYVYLKLQHMEQCYTDIKYCLSTIHKYSEGGDITYNFLLFIKQIRLKLLNRMVSLYSEQKSDVLTLQEQVLQEQYPHLSTKQIHFYVRHRIPYHYYTIAHYMQECAVCYETARTAMDELVSEKWYSKRKVGKKFLYYILE